MQITLSFLLIYLIICSILSNCSVISVAKTTARISSVVGDIGTKGMEIAGSLANTAQLAAQYADASQKQVLVEMVFLGFNNYNGLENCYYKRYQWTSDRRRSWIIAPTTFCFERGISFEVGFDDGDNDKVTQVKYRNLQDDQEFVIEFAWDYRESDISRLTVRIEGNLIFNFYDETDQPQYKINDFSEETAIIHGFQYTSRCTGGFDIATVYPDIGNVNCILTPLNEMQNFVFSLQSPDSACVFVKDPLAHWNVLINGDTTFERYLLVDNTYNYNKYNIYCNGNQFMFNFMQNSTMQSATNFSGSLLDSSAYDGFGAISAISFEVNGYRFRCITTRDKITKVIEISTSCSYSH